MSLEGNRLLETNESLRGAGNALSDLIEESPHIAHLKDAQTGKYILSNRCWAERLAIAPADIAGLTYDDIAGESPNSVYSKWSSTPSFTSWKSNIREKVAALELHALQTQKKQAENYFGFTPNGFILSESFVKIPILSQDSRHTIAILTYSQDLTPQQRLPELFNLYKRFYDEKEAIQLLLEYLDIDYYFNELPTEKEIQALFKIQQDFGFTDEKINPGIRSVQAKVNQENWHEILMRLSATHMAI